MNRPMPTPIESLIESGTARTIASRSPARTSTSAMTPSITTHDIATGHGSPCAEDDVEGDDGVDPEARRERERHVRDQPHRRGQQRRGERGGDGDAGRPAPPAADRIAGLTNRM